MSQSIYSEYRIALRYDDGEVGYLMEQGTRPQQPNVDYWIGRGSGNRRVVKAWVQRRQVTHTQSEWNGEEPPDKTYEMHCCSHEGSPENQHLCHCGMGYDHTWADYKNFEDADRKAFL